MSLVKDTLRSSTVTDELSDDEVQVIEGMFDVQEYKSGEVIVQPGDAHPDNLYILAHGDIEVKIESGDGESIIHVLKPGDLAGMNVCWWCRCADQCNALRSGCYQSIELGTGQVRKLDQLPSDDHIPCHAGRGA